MLRFLTAGESHGRALVSILEGIPSGLTIDFTALTAELRRRQGGYGRGRGLWLLSFSSGRGGAGEGNRTLVCSLGSCRSAIELHPREPAF